MGSILKSFFQYAWYVPVTLGRSDLRNMAGEEFRKMVRGREHWEAILKGQKGEEGAKEGGLEKAIAWLGQAQDHMEDDGFGSYQLIHGWTTSYPETTGYIIPTLLAYGHRKEDVQAKERARTAADWLVSIQRADGGWQGGRIGEKRGSVVFNTGQVIRGLNAAYRETEREAYLKAAVRAGDWLVSVQEPEGCWVTHSFLNRRRVYDSYVAAPLMELGRLSGREEFREGALRNLEWIVPGQQCENGWFVNADNTVHRNNEPILHTIAYTIDGLLEAGEGLDREDFIRAARKPAEILKDKFLEEGYLYARYDRNWRGCERFIPPGGAQMAVAWGKLYRLTGENDWKEAHQRMTRFLLYLQEREHDPGVHTRGALAGSFPFWGRYERFALPNWGTKFFADALMMDL